MRGDAPGSKSIRCGSCVLSSGLLTMGKLGGSLGGDCVFSRGDTRDSIIDICEELLKGSFGMPRSERFVYALFARYTPRPFAGEGFFVVRRLLPFLSCC